MADNILQFPASDYMSKMALIKQAEDNFAMRCSMALPAIIDTLNKFKTISFASEDEAIAYNNMKKIINEMVVVQNELRKRYPSFEAQQPEGPTQ